jgi:hypothetical protein
MAQRLCTHSHKICTVYRLFHCGVLPLVAVRQLLPHMNCAESVQSWTSFLLLPLWRSVILNGDNTLPIAVVACLLGLRVLVPPVAWTFVSCKHCVLCRYRTLRGPILRTGESYRVYICVCVCVCVCVIECDQRNHKPLHLQSAGRRGQTKKERKKGNTRVAQKVMPNIFFFGNYLFRTYEIHTQYIWTFPLHMLFFHMHALVSRWRKAVDVDGEHVEK